MLLHLLRSVPEVRDLYSVVDRLHFSHISRAYCSFVLRVVSELGDGESMSFQSIQNLLSPCNVLCLRHRHSFQNNVFSNYNQANHAYTHSIHNSRLRRKLPTHGNMYPLLSWIHAIHAIITRRIAPSDTRECFSRRCNGDILHLGICPG